MNFLAFGLLLLSTAILGKKVQYSHIDLPGQCPKNLKIVSNPHLALLQGAWYVNFITNPEQHGCDKGCWSAYAIKVADNEMTVSICCQKHGKPLCQEIVGSGTITENNCEPGLFESTSHWKQSPEVILDVSYDDDNGFWIGYICDSYRNGTTKSSAIALSRNPVPPPSHDKHVLETYRKNHIDTSGLMKVRQHHKCNYPFGCTRKTCVEWYYRRDLQQP